MSDVERIARRLYVASGENPDRRLHDYGRTSGAYPAWEDFRDDARRQLDAEVGQGSTMCPGANFEEPEPDYWQPLGAVARLVVNGLRKVTS